jgi:hypothetical protein
MLVLAAFHCCAERHSLACEYYSLTLKWQYRISVTAPVMRSSAAQFSPKRHQIRTEQGTAGNIFAHTKQLEMRVVTNILIYLLTAGDKLILEQFIVTEVVNKLSFDYLQTLALNMTRFSLNETCI